MQPWPFNKSKDHRAARGYFLAHSEDYEIRLSGFNTYICPSEAGGTAVRLYCVNLVDVTCECIDFKKSNGYLLCKHIYACRFRFGDLQDIGPPPIDEDESRRKRNRIQGNRWWGGKSLSKRRNDAYVEMIPRMEQAIYEICEANIAAPPRQKSVGKPPFPKRDMAKLLLSKIDNRKGYRGHTSYVENMAEDGRIDRTVHYNRICEAMVSDEYTPLIHKLL